MGDSQKRKSDSKDPARRDQWLAAAREGSKSNLGRLLESYRTYLKVVAAREIPKELRGKESSSDLAQKTLARAAQKFHAFQGVCVAQFEAWLHKVRRAQTVMLLRQYLDTGKRDVRREVPIDPNDSKNAKNNHPPGREPAPFEQLLNNERDDRVRSANARLAPSEQQIMEIVQAQKGSLSWDDIANKLNITMGAARARWLRAIDKLKPFLKDRDGE